ncbi:MAG: glycosyltransferase family 2 protein, partial [Chitinophagaceae bacterium]
YAGAAGGFMDFLGYTFCRGRIFESIEEDKGQYDSIMEIFWASGAAFFVRSSVFHLLGGLDDFFFAHMEEIDFCWRVHNRGFKVLYCPQSLVFHVGGGSLPKGNPWKTYLNFRNNLIMLSKNLRPKNRGYRIFLRLFLDEVVAIKSVLAGDFKDFLAIFKAHMHFYQWWRQNGRSRKELEFPLPDLETIPGIYSGSIVWQYFIKGKKIFSQFFHN